MTIYNNKDYIKIAPKKYKNQPKNFKMAPTVFSTKKYKKPLKIKTHHKNTKKNFWGDLCIFLGGKPLGQY